MGFEYKILVDLTPQQALDLQGILLRQIGFSRKPYKENDFIEFRHPENDNPNWMPNLTLLFETDGLYVCNYSITPIWEDLHTIKNYLEQHHLTFHIHAYSD